MLSHAVHSDITKEGTYRKGQAGEQEQCGSLCFIWRTEGRFFFQFKASISNRRSDFLDTPTNRTESNALGGSINIYERSGR
jgi:hypothetical protein